MSIGFHYLETLNQSSSLVFIIGAIIAMFSLILSFLVPLKPDIGYETTLKQRV